MKTVTSSLSELRGIPSDTVVTVKAPIEGPKWANAKEEIEMLCHMDGIKHKVLYHRRGWFKEKVIFEFEGTAKEMVQLIVSIRQAIDEYNSH